MKTARHITILSFMVLAVSWAGMARSTITVTPHANVTGTEGSSCSVSPLGTFTDSVGTSVTEHSAYMNWDDGTSVSLAITDYGVSGTLANASRTYVDNGSYTIVTTVTATGGLSGVGSLTATIANANPAVTATSASVTIVEGATVSINPLGTYTDAGSIDTHTAIMDWGDGTTVSKSCTAGSIAAATHAYVDNGTYVTTITVIDNNGGSGVAVGGVTVTNAAPVVTDAGNKTAVEGGTLTINPPATYTDAGSADTHTAIVYWGDGSYDAKAASGGNVASSAHAYTDNGAFTVTIVVTDDDGGVGTDTLTATISNANPVVTATSAKTGNEGATLTVTAPASFTDAGSGDTHTAIIDWDDGTTASVAVTDYGASGTLASASHAYTDNGVYSVTVTVTDDDGGTDSDTFTETVANVAPVVTATSNKTAAEGATLTVAVPATYTDAGSADTHTALIAWGDGSAATKAATGGNVASSSHAYADNGTYTVSVSVTDDDSGITTATFTATISNALPVITPTSNKTGAEGSAVTISPVATYTDAGTGDTHTGRIYWGDSATASVITTGGNFASVSHTYTDNGAKTITVVVTDDDGGVATGTLTATIANALPVIATVATAFSGVENVAVSMATPATYTDAGSADTHTARIYWGDTTNESAVAAVGTVAAASHTYSADGTYTIYVVVTDDDAGVATGTTYAYIANDVEMTKAKMKGVFYKAYANAATSSVVTLTAGGALMSIREVNWKNSAVIAETTACVVLQIDSNLGSTYDKTIYRGTVGGANFLFYTPTSLTLCPGDALKVISPTETTAWSCVIIYTIN